MTEIKTIDRETFIKLCEIARDCIYWDFGDFDKKSFEISLKEDLNIEVVETE